MNLNDIPTIKQLSEMRKQPDIHRIIQKYDYIFTITGILAAIIGVALICCDHFEGVFLTGAGIASVVLPYVKD